MATTVPTITIALDPAYPAVQSITPVNLAEAISQALAFGTDDPLTMYQGSGALSAPLLDWNGDTFGMLHVGVTK